MTQPTVDSLLMGGGAPFFTFAAKNQIGQFVSKPYGPSTPTKVSGTVASIGEPQQQTDYTTNALLTWTDGKPRLQFAVTLDVDWQNTVDWVNPDAWQRIGQLDPSDTQRSVMIKQSTQLQGALRDAIKDAGGANLQLGAYVSIELTSEQPSSKGNPLKVYTVQYKLPAQGVVMDGGGGAASAYPAQVTAPAPQPNPVAQQAQAYQQHTPAPVQVGQQGAGGAGQAATPVTQGTGAVADPFEIARKLFHELKLPAEQVAATTGLTVEQVNQIPPF